MSRNNIPFSDEELQTLARRARESFAGSERKKERFKRYQQHLAGSYGIEVVSAVAVKLEEINNRIGYEEK